MKQFAKRHAEGDLTPDEFGGLLYEHHCALRDGLGISTPAIEEILGTALENGALGGKLNGTGGGGCCYIFAHKKDMVKIKAAVEDKGYPARIIRTDYGVCVDGRTE